MSNTLARYLARRADLARRPLVCADTTGVDRIVVIPALRERESLPKTLKSLAANPANVLERTLVIVVINNRIDNDDATVENNRDTQRWLEQATPAFAPMRIAHVDAFSPGGELGAKEGVGAARKIGMDWAVEILRRNEQPRGVIVSLDADTLVEPNYLESIADHFTDPSAWGAAIGFAHPIIGTERERAAIVWYETFLRYWVLGLSCADSPYAYLSIGSAMACTAEAYVAAGGMNRRQAGEDFYFLQELAKTGTMERISDTVVHPSPRISDRVPFGTGRRMRAFIEDDPADSRAYHPAVFDILKRWISIMRATPAGSNAVLHEAQGIAPPLADFLEAQKVEQTWPRLDRNARIHEQLVEQRMRWFDAFRTLKCLHYLRDHGYPDQPLFESVACLLGEPTPIGALDDQVAFLHRLRGRDALQRACTLLEIAPYETITGQPSLRKDT